MRHYSFDVFFDIWVGCRPSDWHASWQWRTEDAWHNRVNVVSLRPSLLLAFFYLNWFKWYSIEVLLRKQRNFVKSLVRNLKGFWDSIRASKDFSKVSTWTGLSGIYSRFFKSLLKKPRKIFKDLVRSLKGFWDSMVFSNFSPLTDAKGPLSRFKKSLPEEREEIWKKSCKEFEGL